MEAETARDAAARTIEAVWPIESARIIGGLARVVGDISAAEDLAQDALVAALETWPESGIPDNPGAWLMAAAKRRAIDHVRRDKLLERKHDEIAREPGEPHARERELLESIDDPVGDDVLGLMFTVCHPMLSTEARVALTLRLLGGLGSDEIARAFLVPVATLRQRIVRAKRTLREARVRIEVPRGDELSERLPSVLDVLYLIFNEGYSATEGEDWVRPALCHDALRLARMLSELAPEEPEVHGLVALMEIQASRLRARVDSNGEPVLLFDQDRGRWDHVLIRRGLAGIERAAELGKPLGPYWLQAAIAACHARAPAPDETDWEQIVALYDALVEVTASPVVALNRAVAVGMAFGAEAGLELVDELSTSGELDDYHLLASARGHLLTELGRTHEARAEFERAASMTGNLRERTLLLARAAECGDGAAVN